MRNRFWIALVFTIPLFVYSPMGEMFTPPRRPFGLRLNLWLFLLATAAIIYPISELAVLRCRLLLDLQRLDADLFGIGVMPLVQWIVVPAVAVRIVRQRMRAFGA